MTGWFPARTADTHITAPITIDDVCTGFSYVPLKYMYKQIQHDFRKMASELVGLPPKHDHDTSSGNQVAHLRSDKETTSSVIPLSAGKLVELDEAVIHFRCGDLMDSDNKSYGFMTFKGYMKHVPSNTKTIGIITQPFDDVDGGSGIQNRKEDASIHQRQRCRIVVLSFVEYIQQQYPNASVKVRNTVGETITIAFSRMILSNTSIAGTSTFGLLASIATYGTAYIRMPYSSVRFDHLTGGNMVLFDDPDFISVVEMKQVWETQGAAGALQWFWNGTKHSEKEIKM